MRILHKRVWRLQQSWHGLNCACAEATNFQRIKEYWKHLRNKKLNKKTVESTKIISRNWLMNCSADFISDADLQRELTAMAGWNSYAKCHPLFHNVIHTWRVASKVICSATLFPNRYRLGACPSIFDMTLILPFDTLHLDLKNQVLFPVSTTRRFHLCRHFLRTIWKMYWIECIQLSLCHTREATRDLTAQ